MKILLAGPQGSGKTTQATLIAQDLGIPHFSTGRFLRRLAGKNNKTSKIVKKHLTEGTLIPDSLIMKLVDEELAQQHYQSGYVVEGNPRTVSQARKFKDELDYVIYLKLSDRECIKRLLKRKREDDKKKLIEIRLDVYHRETEPMLDYYQNKGALHEIDASPSIASIHNIIFKLLGIVKHASH